MEFVNARLEDMQLPRERYQAVFSASAIHWVDPDLSWRKIADVLAPDGTLALIQYFGLQEPRSADDQEQLLSAMRRHAPEIAAAWPTYRDLETHGRGRAGAPSERRGRLGLARELRHRARLRGRSLRGRAARYRAQARSSTLPTSSTPCSARCHSGHDSPPTSVTPSRARIARSTSAWGGQSGRARWPDS